MLVVTSHLPLITAVRKAVDLAHAKHGIVVNVQIVTALEDAFERETTAFLLLDLAQSVHRPPKEYASLIHGWRMLHPSAKVVAVHSPAQGQLLGAMMHQLAVTGGVREMVPLAEAIFADVWLKYILANPFAILIDSLRRDFSEHVAAKSALFKNSGLIYTLLSHAPHDARLDDTIKRMTIGESKALKIDRHWVWDQLRQEAQAPPSYFCNAFRVSTYLKMRQETDWTPHMIAKYMGFDSARQQMITMKNRFGRTVKEVRQVPYSVALDFAVDLCMMRLDGEPPLFRELFGPVVDQYTGGTSTDPFLIPFD